MKKRGRPKKQKEDIRRALLEFLYLFTGDSECREELNKFKLTTEEIANYLQSHIAFLEVQKGISEIFREKVDCLDLPDGDNKLVCHWLLNRYVIFRLLRTKFGYGSILESAFESQEDKIFETIKEMLFLRPEKEFSRKGGPIPLYENLTILRILDSMFHHYFPKRNNLLLYETLYCSEIQDFLIKSNVTFPDDIQFGKYINRECRKITFNEEKGLYTNQDAHLLYFPKTVLGLKEQIKENVVIDLTWIDIFLTYPTLTAEYHILKTLPPALRADLIKVFKDL